MMSLPLDADLVTAVLPDDLADAWPLAFERDAVLEDEQYDRPMRP